MLEKWTEKAEVLIESLPYIKSFQGKYFVIKYGGAAMEDPNMQKDIIHDMILLKFIGIKPVIVHGGGKEINKYLEKMNLSSRFVNGLRITEKDTMDVVEMVLRGKINTKIVSLINLYGGKGVGISGKDSDIILARKKLPVSDFDSKNKKEEKVDLGFVGEIEKIDSSLIVSLCDMGYIPVISPIGVGLDGESYNINADEVASEIAQSLKAEKLIMLTDVDGIYEVQDKPSTKITTLTITKAEQLIEKSEISGGMIPKVNACINAISNGVNRTHIIDGTQKHSILIEVFTDRGIGTMVVGD